MDKEWWDVYITEVQRDFSGARFSNNRMPKRYNVEHLPSTFKAFGNSGAGAVSLAVFGGASRVILLGFDCKYGDNGQKHWHGDHPPNLGNAKLVDRWHKKFSELARHVGTIDVINATRDTALTCFARGDLEDCLK